MTEFTEVSRLMKIIERMVSDNEKLRRAPGIVNTERLQKLEVENDSLKTQMNELRQSIGTQLSDRYNAKERGVDRLMREYDDVRRQLHCEVADHAHTRAHRDKLAREVIQLQNRCADLESQHRTTTQPKTVAQTFTQKLKYQDEALKEAEMELSATRRHLGETLKSERQLGRENKRLRSTLDMIESSATDFDTASVADLFTKLRFLELKLDRVEAEKLLLMGKLEESRGSQVDEGTMKLIADIDALEDENAKLALEMKLLKTDSRNGSREIVKEVGNAERHSIETAKLHETMNSYKQQLLLLSRQFGVDVKL